MFCSHGLVGTGLARVFLLTAALLSALETISPGLAVPEASTTSLVLPAEGGLKGAVGPDDEPPCCQGFGGGLLAATTKIHSHKIKQEKSLHNQQAHEKLKTNQITITIPQKLNLIAQIIPISNCLYKQAKNWKFKIQEWFWRRSETDNENPNGEIGGENCEIKACDGEIDWLIDWGEERTNLIVENLMPWIGIVMGFYLSALFVSEREQRMKESEEDEIFISLSKSGPNKTTKTPSSLSSLLFLTPTKWNIFI